MGTDIDPVEFGKMMATLASLDKTVPALFAQIRELNDKIGKLENQITSGRGIALGLAIAAGGVGAAMHRAMEAIFK